MRVRIKQNPYAPEEWWVQTWHWWFPFWVHNSAFFDYNKAKLVALNLRRPLVEEV